TLLLVSLPAGGAPPSSTAADVLRRAAPAALPGCTALVGTRNLRPGGTISAPAERFAGPYSIGLPGLPVLLAINLYLSEHGRSPQWRELAGTLRPLGVDRAAGMRMALVEPVLVAAAPLAIGAATLPAAHEGLIAQAGEWWLQKALATTA